VLRIAEPGSGNVTTDVAKSANPGSGLIPLLQLSIELLPVGSGGSDARAVHV
jgi:hypothetical protein